MTLTNHAYTFWKNILGDNVCDLAEKAWKAGGKANIVHEPVKYGEFTNMNVFLEYGKARKKLTWINPSAGENGATQADVDRIVQEYTKEIISVLTTHGVKPTINGDSIETYYEKLIAKHKSL